MARPLPDPVLFLDECLGTGDVAKALREAGVQVELLLDHFATGTPDEEWLPEVGRRGWVLLTKDKWIRRRAVEMRALTNSGVPAFVLSSGDMSGAEMGKAFVQACPRMRKILRDYEPPFVAAVQASGRIRLLTDPARRAARRK